MATRTPASSSSSRSGSAPARAWSLLPSTAWTGRRALQRVEQVGGHHVAGVEDGVARLDVVPYLGRQRSQVAAQVGVGEDEQAQRVGDHGPILPRRRQPAGLQRLVAKKSANSLCNMPSKRTKRRIKHLDGGSLRRSPIPCECVSGPHSAARAPPRRRCWPSGWARAPAPPAIHLRVLASHGFIEEDTGRGTARAVVASPPRHDVVAVGPVPRRPRRAGRGAVALGLPRPAGHGVDRRLAGAAAGRPRPAGSRPPSRTTTAPT